MQTERLDRLNTMISENRITRRQWYGRDEEGRQTACLLAALSPEAGRAEDYESCPAEVMPSWLAELTPWMDDYGTDAAWPHVVKRYAACAARWHKLDDAAWRRVEIAARRASLSEVMSYTIDEQVLGVCQAAIDWLDDGMPETPPSQRLDMTTVTWSPNTLLAAFAPTAATGPTWSAGDAVELVWRAANVASPAASAATMDRITNTILSALEKECGL